MEEPYREEELDVNVVSALSKIRRRVIVELMLCYILVPTLIVLIICTTTVDSARLGELAVLILAGIVIWFMIIAARKKGFKIIESSYYQVSGLAVDE